MISHFWEFQPIRFTNDGKVFFVPSCDVIETQRTRSSEYLLHFNDMMVVVVRITKLVGTHRNISSVTGCHPSARLSPNSSNTRIHHQ
jgi:hypothetical protein